MRLLLSVVLTALMSVQSLAQTLEPQPDPIGYYGVYSQWLICSPLQATLSVQNNELAALHTQEDQWNTWLDVVDVVLQSERDERDRLKGLVVPPEQQPAIDSQLKDVQNRLNEWAVIRNTVLDNIEDTEDAIDAKLREILDTIRQLYFCGCPMPKAGA